MASGVKDESILQFEGKSRDTKVAKRRFLTERPGSESPKRDDSANQSNGLNEIFVTEDAVALGDKSCQSIPQNERLKKGDKSTQTMLTCSTDADLANELYRVKKEKMK